METLRHQVSVPFSKAFFQGFRDPITVVTADKHPPYDRVKLSKVFSFWKDLCRIPL